MRIVALLVLFVILAALGICLVRLFREEDRAFQKFLEEMRNGSVKEFLESQKKDQK